MWSSLYCRHTYDLQLIDIHTRIRYRLMVENQLNLQTTPRADSSACTSKSQTALRVSGVLYSPITLTTAICDMSCMHHVRHLPNVACCQIMHSGMHLRGPQTTMQAARLRHVTCLLGDPQIAFKLSGVLELVWQPDSLSKIAGLFIAWPRGACVTAQSDLRWYANHAFLRKHAMRRLSPILSCNTTRTVPAGQQYTKALNSTRSSL